MSVAAFALVFATQALAQPAATEDPDLLRGIQLRKESRDAEALVEFRRSFAQHATSRARAQIALALQALGRWLEAETELRAALDDRSDAWIARNRDALERAEGTIAQHLGTFEGICDVDATELFVNGVRVDPGHPLRVVAGSIVVEARAAGYAPVRRAVDVPPMGVARETFTMAKLAPMATEDSAPLPAAITSTPARSAPLVTETPSPRGGTAQRTWGWVAVAAGSASLVAGVAATVIRENNAQAYNDEEQCPASDRSRLCASKRDTVNLATGVAIGGYVAAGALLTTGVVLLVTAAKGEKAAAPMTGLSAWVAPAAGGVGFQRAF